MRIYQMTNHNGNAWANQVVIEFERGKPCYCKILQSYQSLVCMIDLENNKVDFGDDWDYSRTTMKAVCKFLSDEIGGKWDKKEIERALKDGYITINNGYKCVGWEFSTACDDFFSDFFKYAHN